MRFEILKLAAAVLVLPLSAQKEPMTARLLIVDPGHFHASLLQREMYPDVGPRVSVYAPLGPELLDYLNRISLFNGRKQDPTHWELDVHCTAHPMEEMLRDRAGNVVVLTGRNRGKIDRILASVTAGMHVLADKPWIISSSEIPKLQLALNTADKKGVIAYDIMTERFEVTSELQRVLVNTPAVFGTLVAGTADDPGIRARSVHNLMKVVAGVPLRRPVWFFNVAEYGEGLADVGTHVVDLVQWTALPDQAFDYRKDVKVLEGRRWPVTLTKTQFAQVTGEADFPEALSSNVHDGKFDYFCNNSIHYTLRGIHVKLEIVWDWEAAKGAGDVYEAVFRGTKARVEIRQGAAEHFVPELYIVPATQEWRKEVFSALRAQVQILRSRWPGLTVRETDHEAQLLIPKELRVGHEAHFAQVTREFFNFLRSGQPVPEWERSYMLAKYYITTKGVELSRQ
jgi:predicted dehydrogenase